MKSRVTKLCAIDYEKPFRNHMLSSKLLTDLAIYFIHFLRQRVNKDIGDYIFIDTV